MAFRLEPHVAGQLGMATQLDPSSHPPTVTRVEYVLDLPDADDLIESFPVFLVSAALADALTEQGLRGFTLGDATVRPSEEYLAAYGDAPHGSYRWLEPEGSASQDDAWRDAEHCLCVSDRMMDLLRKFRIGNCEVAELTTPPDAGP